MFRYLGQIKIPFVKKLRAGQIQIMLSIIQRKIFLFQFTIQKYKD